jgi:O-antigen/teichoic acid export membrane protein
MLRLLENKTLAKQTTILFTSQVLNMLLGIVLDVVNTRILGKENFGSFSFINAIIFSAVMFFDFGIFFSGSRLLAYSKNNDEERSLSGALLLITLAIGFIFSVTIFISSYILDPIFGTNVGFSLRVVSLLALVYPFQALIPMICRGSNLINKLAVYNVLPKVVYFGLILLFINNLNYTISFALFSISIIIGTIIIIMQIKPDLKNFKDNLNLIKKEFKEYGSKVYTGNIINNLSQYFDRWLISYFINTSSLGSYTISMRITNQIRLVSNSLSISAFKEFADSDKISRSTLNLNLFMLISFSLILYIINPFLIDLLFGKEYIDVVSIIPVLILAMFFGGLTYPYTAFLHAKKKGDYVRNIAIFSPLLNIVLNCVLVPVFGVIGAAWSLVGSLLLSYFLNLFYYKKAITPNKNIEHINS